MARVLYNFQALAARELSVKKGDLVLINKPVNHNWVEVEDTDSGLIVCLLMLTMHLIAIIIRLIWYSILLKGLVPRTYLDFEQEGIAKAKFNFDAKTPVEISFKKVRHHIIC